MAEREDITPPADEPSSDAGVLDAPPREDDVEAEITKSTKRAWLIGAGALLVVALIAALALSGGEDSADGAIEDDASSETSHFATASLPATSSYMETSTVDLVRPSEEVDDTLVDDTSDGVGADSEFTDAGMVAYRMGDEIWVAGEDGSRPHKVTDLAEGAFALSPDGTMLATVSPSNWTLRIVQNDSGSYIEVGAADVTMLAWSPDSRRLLYSDDQAGAHVYDVVSDTVLDIDLPLTCCEPRFSRDGRTIGLAPDTGTSHQPPHFVVTTLGGEAVEYAATASLADFAWHGDVVCYSVRPGEDQPVEIRCASLKASTGEPHAELIGEPLVSPPHGVGFMVGLTRLMLSPDGSMLAYTASGDDGYSRLYVVPVTGGQPTELSIRRDAYPLRWSSDGDYLLFIEGNAFQGEETRLMRVHPDGMGRETLIEGAGL